MIMVRRMLAVLLMAGVFFGGSSAGPSSQLSLKTAPIGTTSPATTYDATLPTSFMTVVVRGRVPIATAPVARPNRDPAGGHVDLRAVFVAAEDAAETGTAAAGRAATLGDVTALIPKGGDPRFMGSTDLGTWRGGCEVAHRHTRRR